MICSTEGRGDKKVCVGKERGSLFEGGGDSGDEVQTSSKKENPSSSPLPVSSPGFPH